MDDRQTKKESRDAKKITGGDNKRVEPKRVGGKRKNKVDEKPTSKRPSSMGKNIISSKPSNKEPSKKPRTKTKLDKKEGKDSGVKTSDTPKRKKPTQTPRKVKKVRDRIMKETEYEERIRFCRLQLHRHRLNPEIAHKFSDMILKLQETVIKV